MIISGRVGWGCTVYPISSNVAPISKAREISLIKSEASGPTIWAPSKTPVFASATILTKPSSDKWVKARPDDPKEAFPTIISNPASFASFSVNPAVEISGSVNIALGIDLKSASAGSPAITSAAIIPCFVALWAVNGIPVQSPIA